MATKSKLERAVEERAKTLNDAQRELLLSQFRTYKDNKARIVALENRIGVLDVQNLANPDKEKLRLAERSSLVMEKSQLTEVNDGIAANLFKHLKE